MNYTTTVQILREFERQRSQPFSAFRRSQTAPTAYRLNLGVNVVAYRTRAGAAKFTQVDSGPSRTRRKEMKSHRVAGRLLLPSRCSTLRASGNDRPGLTRRQSRSRLRGSYKEVGRESHSLLASLFLSRGTSRLRSDPPHSSASHGSIISTGAAANGGSRLATGGRQ